MTIEITHCSAGKVHFRTEGGNAFGIWRGATPAAIGQEHVEIAIETALVWDENIRFQEGSDSQISVHGTDIRIVAEIISLEQDNCVVARLGKGVLLLETSGPPPKKQRNMIEIVVPEIFLYPRNI